MSRKWRNILIGVLIAVLVIGGVWFLNRGPLDFRDKYEGANLSAEVTGIGRSNTYTAYLEQYADLPAVSEAVEVVLASFEGEGGEICADGLRENEVREALLLASEGTIESGIYQRACQARGIRYKAPQREEYTLLRDCIEAVKRNQYTDTVRDVFLELLHRERVCILGCTELPVAFSEFGIDRPNIDPTHVLAAAAVRAVGAPLKEEIRQMYRFD